jgi:signal transduction histidine kinase
VAFPVRFRVPLGLRVFFRSAFVLLILATLGLALSVLVDEKQRSYRNYAEGLRKNQAQIAARLRHPTGQLALLNPAAPSQATRPLRPLVLPFSAIDFDDRSKALQAVEMAGCALQYPDTSTLCVGVGANPYAGGFVYVVGSFVGDELAAHRPGELTFDNAHRVSVTLIEPEHTTRWIAPYELASDGRGRLTAFIDGVPVTRRTRPVRDFRGWLWQERRCVETAPRPVTDPVVDTGVDPSGSAATRPADTCRHRNWLSLRLPVASFQAALAARQPVWPPADIDRIGLRLQVLPPGGGAPIFDSDAAGATLPFALADLGSLLLPGETLHVQRAGMTRDLVTLRGKDDAQEPSSPWLGRLIRILPVEGFDGPIEVRESIATRLGRFELVLAGDFRSVNQRLAAVATRLSGFVAAMLAAVLLTWLALELRIIRRMTLLTRRAAALSSGVRSADGPAALDLSDLRSRDELGVLAQGLQDLLQRVHQDMRREHIRVEQEKDQWHAVGHEIMSPLQSLMALHGAPGDPSARYIQRMQQAMRVLYGQASPSEAFEATTLALKPLDIDAFLGHVAANAAYIGIGSVEYHTRARPLWVRADEYPLEDVVTHVLRNADRHRTPGTEIRITLDSDPEGTQARVTLYNQGPGIASGLLDRIFGYGVSAAGGDAASGGDPVHRGQGLFVARTYMAKMGGTIAASNVDGGVAFTLTLPCSPR